MNKNLNMNRNLNRMMQRILATILVAAATTSLIGCNNDNAVKEEAQKKAATDAQTSSGGPSLANPGAKDKK